MGRPERPVGQNSAELHDFAVALRSLREQAGRPTYEGMARRTGASRTALAQAASGQHLPRWRTVAAYVEACRGDVPDWRRRWDALGVVSGPGTGEDIGTPEQPPTQEVPASGTGEPDPERQRFHRRLLIGGGVLVAAALLAVVTLDRATGALPDAAGVRSVTDAPGVHCDTRPDPAVSIEKLSAADGAPGVAKLNTLRGTVLRPPRPGHTFWLMVHLYSDDGNVYVAKAKLPDTPQPITETLQFNDVVGSKRDVYVIEADAVVGVALERNLATQLDGSLDHERARPPLAAVVSPVCFVQRTRE